LAIQTLRAKRENNAQLPRSRARECVAHFASKKGPPSERTGIVAPGEGGHRLDAHEDRIAEALDRRPDRRLEGREALGTLLVPRFPSSAHVATLGVAEDDPAVDIGAGRRKLG
jgi:hypothetical protein